MSDIDPIAPPDGAPATAAGAIPGTTTEAGAATGTTVGEVAPAPVPSPDAPALAAAAEMGAITDEAVAPAVAAMAAVPAAGWSVDAAAPVSDEMPAPPDDAGPGTRMVTRIGGYVLAAVVGGAVVVAVLAATGRVTSGSVGTGSPSPSVSGTAAPSASGGGAIATSGQATGDGAAPVLGDPAAPVLLEVWADYQCPYCGLLTHGVEPGLVRDMVMAGTARLAYRDFAFLGQESLDAAAAARCAGQQGEYWQYHDLLFASQQGENQGAFAKKNLEGLATFAGLDATAFAKCMDAGTTAAAATAETAAGRTLGVESTPTIHVVGPKGSTLLKGLVPLAAIEKAVRQSIDGTLPSPSPEAPASPAPGASASPAASGSAAP